MKSAFVMILLTLVFAGRVAAGEWHVSPAGADTNAGTAASPFKTIQKAIDSAMPGDIVRLGDGVYLQNAITKRNGQPGAPITITGARTAVVKGSGGSRIFEINHDYIVLSGFTLDGKWGSGTSTADYRDKTLYIIGKDPREGVTGVRITGMKITNAAGECVRLRYFSTNNEIDNNEIGPCGVDDFQFNGGGKNGEGIYVGTAPEQRGMNGAPTADPDISKNNRIHSNTIDTQGGECVDVKEDATENIVENNICRGSKDPDSAGLDSRGNNNVFRGNTVEGSVGAGVRVGGDTRLYGIDNTITGNTLINNRVGGIKFMAHPQRLVCGNIMSGNVGGNSVGTYKANYTPTDPCPDITSPPTQTPVPTVIATATPPPSETPAPSITGGPACREGDANHDGKITLADFEAWRRIFKSL